MTGLEKGDGGVVVDRFGVHRVDDAHIIGDLTVMRKDITDPLSTLAVLGEGSKTLGHGERLLPGGHSGETLTLANGVGQFGAIQFFQRGLVVESLHLARSTGLAKVNDPFGFSREMGGAILPWTVAGAIIGGE